MFDPTLTRDTLHRRAPAIFAEAPELGVSERYGFVPTISVVEALEQEGWFPVHARQTRAQDPERLPFARHMVRFRQDPARQLTVGDSVAELVLTNSHDRTSAFQLELGLFRLVCGNGMVAPAAELGAMRVRHGRHVVDSILEHAVALVGHLPRIAERVDAFRSTPVSRGEEQRFAEAALRLRYGEEWLYVYILLEFQSTVDPYMAVRMPAYVSLLYQDLIRQEKLTQKGLLPPVLPLVLYNGEPRWSAATEVDELIERVPGGLEQYRPSMQYLLLDEGRILEQEETSTELKNLVHALFRLEYSRDEQDLIRVLAQVVEWLRAPEQRGLRRAFLTWFRRVYLRRKHVPEPDRELIDQAQELEEVHEMLAERVEQWHEYWKQEGRQEGSQETAAKTLLRLIERKFGPESREASRDRVERAAVEELETWLDRILDAERLEDVFAGD